MENGSSFFKRVVNGFSFKRALAVTTATSTTSWLGLCWYLMDKPMSPSHRDNNVITVLYAPGGTAIILAIAGGLLYPAWVNDRLLKLPRSLRTKK